MLKRISSDCSIATPPAPPDFVRERGRAQIRGVVTRTGVGHVGMERRTKPVAARPAPEATISAAATPADRGVKVKGSETAAWRGLVPDNPPLHQVKRWRPGSILVGDDGTKLNDEVSQSILATTFERDLPRNS